MTAQDLAFNVAAIGGVPVAIKVYKAHGILLAVGAWLGVFFLAGIVLTFIFGMLSRTGN